VKKLLIALVLIPAGGAAILFAAAFPDAILAGDAEAYRERMAELFSGNVPYVDFDFEHLPGSIVPMAAAWLLGGHAGLQEFALGLAGVSVLLIVGTGALLVDLEDTIGDRLALRWTGAVVPLMPFLLFRNDSWSVLLIVFAFWLAVRGAIGYSATASAWLGVVSKLWPGAWGAVEWWRGRRARALVTATLVVAALLLLRSGPILRIQRPVGVHTETLAGSVLALVRISLGQPLGLEQTSALYIEAPWWAHLINVTPALVLVCLCLPILRRPFTWAGAWLLSGLLIGLLMVASPLFSTQYMAWITPFAATERRPWLLLVGLNVLSLILITTWTDGLAGEGQWFLLVLLRNLGLLVLLGLITRALWKRSDVQRLTLTAE
jgi:hypothetical protein